MYKAYIKNDKWKKILKKTISLAQEKGIPDICIESTAKAIASVATSVLEPDTDGEKVFFDLWNNANSGEKKILAKLIVRIVGTK